MALIAPYQTIRKYNQEVRVSRYNRMLLKREIREWQFARQKPRLIKHVRFTNNPTITE